MYELVTTLVRQVLLLVGGALISKGMIDSSLLEPVVGVGVAAFAIGWAVIYRRFFSSEKED